MTPTDILKHEHELILRVLDAAENEWQTIDATGTLHADILEKLLDFFRNFADRCHHAKEEKVLFIKMQAKGMPAEGGPIGVMLHEHTVGRHYLSVIADSLPAARQGNALAIEALQEVLGGYIQLLRAHISKENNILFPLADRLLSADDQHEVVTAFEHIESVEIGEGVHERFHELAHELTAAKQ